MSAFNDISIALNQRLQGYAVANDLDVAYENITYEPTTGTIWVRPTVLPAAVNRIGMKNTDTEIHEGVYQIDVFAPSDQPKAIALALADDISDYFSKGLTLTYNSSSVRIGTKSVGAGSREDSWYQLPVFINYYSIT